MQGAVFPSLTRAGTSPAGWSWRSGQPAQAGACWSEPLSGRGRMGSLAWCPARDRAGLSHPADREGRVSLVKSAHPCVHRFEAQAGSSSPRLLRPICPSPPALGRGGGLIQLGRLPPAWASSSPFCGPWAQEYFSSSVRALLPPVADLVLMVVPQWEATESLTTESQGNPFNIPHFKAGFWTNQPTTAVGAGDSYCKRIQALEFEVPQGRAWLWAAPGGGSMSASGHHVLSFGPGLPCCSVSKCGSFLPWHPGPEPGYIIDAINASEIYFPVLLFPPSSFSSQIL